MQIKFRSQILKLTCKTCVKKYECFKTVQVRVRSKDRFKHIQCFIYVGLVFTQTVRQHIVYRDMYYIIPQPSLGKRLVNWRRDREVVWSVTMAHIICPLSLPYNSQIKVINAQRGCIVLIYTILLGYIHHEVLLIITTCHSPNGTRPYSKV